MSLYRKRAMSSSVLMLSMMTLLILLALVTGIIKGRPGLGPVMMLAPVAVGCTVLAIVGWRKDRALLACSAAIAFLVALGCLRLLG
ncbi:hypothetical protein AB0D04_18350 [Streptomyces sp. NPDC048483]|uniref:hypothetical protein n=1 Tax=Streptomyces sp. NPDC048483 TaxID=3154927 RepID=UPI00343326CE